MDDRPSTGPLGRSEKAALVSGSSSALLGRRRRVSVVSAAAAARGWAAAARGWAAARRLAVLAAAGARGAGQRQRPRGPAASLPGAAASYSGPAASPNRRVARQRRRAVSPSVRPPGRARSAEPYTCPACPRRDPARRASCRLPGPGRPAGPWPARCRAQRCAPAMSPLPGAGVGSRFLLGGSCWAVRAVVASGLSEARSSQNCSSLTPPNVSAGHSSSSRSAPLRKPTRRRGLAILAAGRVSPAPRAAAPSFGSVAVASPGVGSSGHESSGQELPASASPGHGSSGGACLSPARLAATGSAARVLGRRLPPRVTAALGAPRRSPATTWSKSATGSGPVSALG